MRNDADKNLKIFFNQVMIGVGIAAFLVHAVFLYAFWTSGVSELVVFNVASLAIFVAVTVLSIQRHTIIAFSLTGVEVVTHAVTAVYFIGWETGFHLYIVLLIPVVLFGARSFWLVKMPLICVVFVVYISMELHFKFNAQPVYVLPPDLVSVLHIANSSMALLFLSFLCGVYNLVVHQSVRRMHKLANTDSLTGLKNRRAIMEKAERYLAGCQASPNAHFIIGDVDYFKRVNDVYGHDAGDVVLRSVARVLESSLGGAGHIARWGGEEFLILAQDRTAQEAAEIAEGIRASVERELISYKDLTIKVTMTLGVSAMRVDESVSAGIDRADKALYVGKQSGRNKVVPVNE